MQILALDLSKYKSVACDYQAETGRHSFATVATTAKGLHDLIVDPEPDRVVIEICSIAGWVCDLVRTLGIEIEVANTATRLVEQRNPTVELTGRGNNQVARPVVVRSPLIRAPVQ